MQLMTFDRMSGKFSVTKKPKPINAILDIGSDKIVCLISRNTLTPDNFLNHEILGYGHHRSQGFQNGMVTDPTLLELAIRSAIEDAEKRASVTVDEIDVNITSHQVESNLYEISVPIKEVQVSKKDLSTAYNIIQEQNNDRNLYIFDTIPLSFSIDGQDFIEDPIGMYGDLLKINFNQLVCNRSIIQNLNNIVENAHLKIERVLFTPIASAAATLSSDEADIGSILIDIGSGTTSYSIFSDNVLLSAGVIPIGGNNLTKEIARTLSTSEKEAEKLKILYGGVLMNSYDNGDTIAVKQIGYSDHENAYKEISKATIADISRFYMVDVFEKVKEKIEKINPYLTKQKRIVLTGGTSQLIGIDDLAEKIFKSPARRALPNLKSSTFDLASPIFSCAIGMLVYAQNETFVNKKITTSALSYNHTNSYFLKLIRWFKDSF